jgi:DNA invertase Pin-like site-specific DNA recombinase
MPKHSISHPYVRISHPDQRRGGGLERQTTADLAEFNRLYGFTLSKRVLVDDGVSAFHGLNATPGHQLGQFLAEARKGLIPAGDCLLIENYDRLSRQDQWAAIGLVSELRSLKIHVGRLDRMKLLRWDSDDPGDFFEAAVEFMRGHSESRAKSVRNGAAWKRKRKAAREDGQTITGRLPAWIEVKDGQRVLIPWKADVIRRVFALAGAGYGHALILKRFAQEGVPPIGKGKHWARSYLAQLLRDRRVLGEFVPRLRNREPAGEAIKDYYPAVVSEEEWLAARGGAAQRLTHPGRRGKHLNVFAGLTRNALDGDSYYAFIRAEKSGTNRVLVNRNSVEGKAPARSFPFVTFERAVLSMLREVDPHAILNGDRAPDESLALAGQLAGVEADLAAMKDFMDKERQAGKPWSPTIGGQITDLEARQRELTERLAEARQRALHPLSESWGECQTLIEALDSAPDPEDARLRLQSILRRIVSSIQMLVVVRGTTRLCAAQIWFAPNDRQRSYLILHTPAKSNGKARTEGGWWCRSLATVHDPAELDLRRPQDARQLESYLAKELDLEKFHTNDMKTS